MEPVKCDVDILGAERHHRVFQLGENALPEGKFSTDGVKMNDQRVQPTTATKRQMAWFFAMHYGIFHAVYFGFLCCTRADITKSGMVAIAVCTAVFAVTHAFSFWYNRKENARGVPNIGTIMFFPYAHIIPMHLTLLLGNLFAQQSHVTLVLFLSLKTVADLIMHLVEHRKDVPAARADNPPGEAVE